MCFFESDIIAKLLSGSVRLACRARSEAAVPGSGAGRDGKWSSWQRLQGAEAADRKLLFTGRLEEEQRLLRGNTDSLAIYVQ